MKDLAKRFLTDSDRKKITDAVQEAERVTSGEIVPMVVSTSYHYPMADVIGGVVFALPISILLTYFVGGWLWIGTQNMWLFLGFLTILFLLFYWTTKNVLWLKRLFISQKEIEEEVTEAAVTHFFGEGLHRTRDETGVLIFISVFEHKVWVLADKGINEKVSGNQWDDIVKIIVEGIKQKNQTEAICQAVKKVGETLHSHFPIKSDDQDELKNLIVEGD